jgi:hypothetical protein
LLEHTDGAVSTLALSLDVPPPAAAFECAFHGATGVATLPGPGGNAVDAFRAAVTQLTAGVRHPCDVHFGRDVVAVLAAAATALRERRVVDLTDPSAW